MINWNFSPFRDHRYFRYDIGGFGSKLPYMAIEFDKTFLVEKSYRYHFYLQIGWFSFSINTSYFKIKS